METHKFFSQAYCDAVSIDAAFEAYKSDVLRTWPYIGPSDQAEEHARLGVISETGEVADLMKRSMSDGKLNAERYLDEVGDVMFYVVARYMSMQKNRDYTLDAFKADVSVALGGTEGFVSAATVHGASRFAMFLFRQTFRNEANWYKAMQANVQKRAERYPDGFSQYKARQ